MLFAMTSLISKLDELFPLKRQVNGGNSNQCDVEMEELEASIFNSPALVLQKENQPFPISGRKPCSPTVVNSQPHPSKYSGISGDIGTRFASFIHVTPT